ncbi:hypothetical protein KKE06_05400 [Candidatus Micrarchaeota archaeon]|nr:hypothetical protein [Candidatus Micrarchaeota archaeon]
MQEIIEKAKVFALNEIEQFGLPDKRHFDFSNQKGQEIAEKLGADKDIVLLGTILMDVKLGECFKEGKLQEHVERSVTATKEFLEQFKLSQEQKNNIINCVAAHHAKEPFICKEAEICANADCYRFLHPKGFFIYITILAKERIDSIEEILKQTEAKIEEKNSILSLSICKEELEPYYKEYKKLIKEAQL